MLHYHITTMELPLFFVYFIYFIICSSYQNYLRFLEPQKFFFGQVI